MLMSLYEKPTCDTKIQAADSTSCIRSVTTMISNKTDLLFPPLAFFII